MSVAKWPKRVARAKVVFGLLWANNASEIIHLEGSPGLAVGFSQPVSCTQSDSGRRTRSVVVVVVFSAHFWTLLSASLSPSSSAACAMIYLRYQ